jgi:hypothetical protein
MDRAKENPGYLDAVRVAAIEDWRRYRNGLQRAVDFLLLAARAAITT